MRAQISNRDYEQLSAYIDEQLAPSDRHKLEERLQARPELQMALDEMSRTRSLLRSAPRRRAPRNFTLTEAMVGERSPRRRGTWWNIFPVLSFTSALATLALVASFIFQVLPGPASQTAAMPQSERVAQVVQATMTAMFANTPGAAILPAVTAQDRAAPEAPKAVPQTEQATQSAGLMAKPMAAQPTATLPPAATVPPETAAGAAQPAAEPTQPAPEAAQPTKLAAPMMKLSPEGTPPIISWGANNAQQGATGMGGGGQGPSLGNLLGPPATPNPQMGLGMGGGGGAAAQGEVLIVPTESINALETPTPSASQTAVPTVEPAQPNQAISGTGPILGVPAPDQGGQIIDRKAILGQPGTAPQNGSAPSPSQPGTQPQGVVNAPTAQTLFGLPALAVIQALLAVLAVVTGAAAYALYRRAR